MKKIITIVLAVLIVLTLSGCGENVFIGGTNDYTHTCQLDMIGSGDETIYQIKDYYILDDYVRFHTIDDEKIYIKHDIINAMICEKVENE